MSRLPPLFLRRDLLRVGSLAVAASALPRSVLRCAPVVNEGKASSVIFLWMAGGVTHIDSFDPKPDAPAEIRGKLRDIPTRLPGTRFCETLPCLARIADQLAVVRSYSHGSNEHFTSQAYALSGHKVDLNGLFTEPNVGSMVSYLQGPRRGLPGYIAVPGTTWPGPPPHNLFVGGWLGNRYAPYAVGGLPGQPDFTATEKVFNPPAEVEEDLVPRSLTLSGDSEFRRLRRRSELREQLDTALRSLDKRNLLGAMEAKYQDALRLLLSPPIRGAFDVSREPAKIRDAYGRTKIGGRCLLARRLVQAGARFVMVDYGYDPDYGNVWDNHNASSQKHPPIQDMCLRGYHLAGMDRAFAALIQDLKDRGLLDSTLVVYLTEFGRTPRINQRGGRDHWGQAGSIFFAGGGTRVGQVVGATDRHGAKPTTRPYSPADVAATIYSVLGIDPQAMVHDILDRPRPVLDHGMPIPEVLS